MAQFTIYRSTDVGAPVLNGLSGSLITVLDAILVNGYGTQPSASWTKPYSSSANDYAIYKQGSNSSGRYLWVQDTESVASGKEAIIRGCEYISGSVFAISGSFSNTFPITTTFTNNGLPVRKCFTTHPLSSSAWIAAADSRTLYFFAKTGDVANTYFSFAFGDIYSYVPVNDPYKCIIIGRNVENSATLANDGFNFLSIAPISGLGSNYINRCFYGGGLGYNISKHVDAERNWNGTVFGNSLSILPNPTDGKIYLSPVWITEYNNILRGHMRGLYNFGHNITALSDGDTFSGSNDMTGRAFLVIKSATTTAYIIETSNTLDTN